MYEGLEFQLISCPDPAANLHSDNIPGCSERPPPPPQRPQQVTDALGSEANHGGGVDEESEP